MLSAAFVELNSTLASQSWLTIRNRALKYKPAIRRVYGGFSVSKKLVFAIIIGMGSDSLFNAIAGLNYAPIVLAIVSVFYWIYVFVMIYHLVRFGVGLAPKILALVFLAGSVMFFTLTLILYIRVDFDGLLANIKVDNLFKLPTIK